MSSFMGISFTLSSRPTIIVEIGLRLTIEHVIAPLTLLGVQSIVLLLRDTENLGKHPLQVKSPVIPKVKPSHISERISMVSGEAVAQEMLSQQ